MKKRSPAVLVLTVGAMCLFASCGLFGGSGSLAYNNPLRNTTWETDVTGGYGALFEVYFTKRIDFGSDNFKITTQLVSAGIPLGNETEIGTYTITGDTVTLTVSDETVLSGMLIGNSLTLDNLEYSRVQ